MDLIKDLTEVEKKLMTIADCVAVKPIKIDENTDLKDLYDDGLISMRSWQCCKRAGLDRMKDVCQLTEDQTMRVRNLGKKSFDEIKKIMKENDMQFAMGSEKGDTHDL